MLTPPPWEDTVPQYWTSWPYEMLEINSFSLYIVQYVALLQQQWDLFPWMRSCDTSLGWKGWSLLPIAAWPMRQCCSDQIQTTVLNISLVCNQGDALLFLWFLLCFCNNSDSGRKQQVIYWMPWTSTVFLLSLSQVSCLSLYYTLLNSSSS